MNDWVLKIQLDGEWEQCTFRTRQQALAAFLALTTDYSVKLERAILSRRSEIPLRMDLTEWVGCGYVN